MTRKSPQVEDLVEVSQYETKKKETKPVTTIFFLKPPPLT